MLLLLAIAAICCTAAPAIAGQPMLEKVDLFVGGEEGYELYRIPGIVVTTKGTVLAYCEARRRGRGDWGTIDIMLRRSTDHGRTWQERQHIAHHGEKVPKNPVALAQNLATEQEQTVNNPVAFVDHQTGAVHMLYCVEYARCFYMRSDDDGLTFSKPVDVTSTFEQFRSDYDWKVIATGPGHGIQLRSGRLVVPIWLSTGTGGHAHRPSVTSTVYSDDHGATWHRGEIAVPNTERFIFPNETVVAELSDGRVMLNVRSESLKNRRLVTTSQDGATGWSEPRFDPALVESICMASIVSYPAQLAGDEKSRLVFANPHNLGRAAGDAEPGKSRDRRRLSIKLSYDDGQTWPVNRVLEPGYSSYSDLAVAHDGSILCLYERGTPEPPGSTRPTKYTHLTIARFNLDWLNGPADNTAKP